MEYQQISSSEFNIVEQAEKFLASGGKILACGTCLKQRNASGSNLCPISSMQDMYKIIAESDKIVKMFKAPVFIRCGCFIAALWYFLVSSSLAVLAVDKILPRHKTVNPSASSCALHGCGCKHNKKSQKGCCASNVIPTKVYALHNHLSGQNEPPRQIRMDFLSVARCKGHLQDDALFYRQNRY